MNTLGLGRSVNTFGLGLPYAGQVIANVIAGTQRRIDLIKQENQDLLDIITMISRKLF